LFPHANSTYASAGVTARAHPEPRNRSASGAQRTNRAGLMTSVVQGNPDVIFPGLDSAVQKSS
jgi:hypothetical protein